METKSLISNHCLSWVLVLTWASCIRTTGMWSLLFCFGVAMLDRVMASSSSSMAGRYSVPLSVVCDPKPRSNARPRVLWLKELLLSFRVSDGKTTRWDKGPQHTYRLYEVSPLYIAMVWQWFMNMCMTAWTSQTVHAEEKALSRSYV